MSENNNDSMKLYNKIDEIYDKIGEVKEDIHRLNVNIAVITEKTKQLDSHESKLGSLEGRVNVFENDLNSIKYKSESLLGRWDKIVSVAVQIIIMVIGAFLVYKLNLIQPPQQTQNVPITSSFEG